MEKIYSLPELPYGYKDLEPYISEEQLTIHYQKHHAAYVKGANETLTKLDEARKSGSDIDIKSILKTLSFHIGGYVLHSLFWQNMAPVNQGGGGEIKDTKLAEIIDEGFYSFERFKKEFTQAAASVEGSGWAVLALDKKMGMPVIMQVEKHNTNMYANFKILMVLDVWEHAYYLDYKNERGKYIDGFWNIVNWQEVENRLNIN